MTTSYVSLQSIILPVYNAELWLEDCLQSVYDQTFSGCLELSAYNDSSTVCIVVFTLQYSGPQCNIQNLLY